MTASSSHHAVGGTKQAYTPLKAALGTFFLFLCLWSFLSSSRLFLDFLPRLSRRSRLRSSLELFRRSLDARARGVGLSSLSLPLPLLLVRHAQLCTLTSRGSLIWTLPAHYKVLREYTQGMKSLEEDARPHLCLRFRLDFGCRSGFMLPGSAAAAPARARK